MDAPDTNLLATLTNAGDIVGGVLLQTKDHRERAKLLAAALRSSHSGAALSSFAVRNGVGAHTVALDAAGKHRPDWLPILDELVLGPDAKPQPPPPAIGLPGVLLLGCPVTYGGRDFGRVVAAAPERAVPAAGALVSRFAQAAAVQLFVEAQQVELLQLRLELQGEAVWADSGELARPLAHDVNNFLNNLVLNLAILEQLGAEEAADGVKRLRRQADQVGGLIREFHEFRARSAPPAGPVDVNQSLRDAAAILAREYADLVEKAAPALELRPDLRSLVGTRGDFVRLGVLLLKNAVQAARLAGGVVRVTSAQEAGHVVVRTDVAGIRVPPEILTKSFEALAGACRGMTGLELAACASIARRFRGRFHCENLSDGLSIVLELPAPAI